MNLFKAALIVGFMICIKCYGFGTNRGFGQVPNGPRWNPMTKSVDVDIKYRGGSYQIRQGSHSTVNDKGDVYINHTHGVSNYHGVTTSPRLKFGGF